MQKLAVASNEKNVCRSVSIARISTTLLLALFTWFQSAAADASVVPGRVELTGSGGQYSLTFRLDGPWTGFTFDKTENGAGDASFLTAVIGYADPQFYYLTPYGAPFTRNSIDAGAFQNWPWYDNTFSLTVPYRATSSDEARFYLGMQSCRNLATFFPPEPCDEVFGWGLFENTAAGLTLLDSAVAYGELGIFIGTYQAVPEPGTYALVLLGFALLVLLQQRGAVVRV